MHMGLEYRPIDREVEFHSGEAWELTEQQMRASTGTR